MGFRYLANKDDIQRQLRARRAAEIANGGGLGTIKLPPLRRNIRGRVVCSGNLPKGSQLIVAVQGNEVVGLLKNVLSVKFEGVNKATMRRLQRMQFAIGEVRRPHHYAPIVDVTIELGASSEVTDVRPEPDLPPSAK